jgi:lipopolysaccharide biosynthesis glycosyltransferase
MTIIEPLDDAARVPAVVCCLDRKYAMCGAVMLKSLELALPIGATANVFVLADSLDRQIAKRISETLDTTRLDVSWIDVDATPVANWPVNGHMSRTTYFRLLIEQSLPTLTRAIYLDADVVVLSDIGQLWSVPMGNAYVLAAAQMSPGTMTAGEPRGLPAFASVGLSADSPLFNAGVMVMNLENWRRDGISRLAGEFLTNYSDKVLWWDQDALNAVLAGKWSPLDPRWNHMSGLYRYYRSWHDSPFSKDQYDRLTAEPWIVHFNSTSKPWDRGYSLPFSDLFFRLVDETAWRGWRPE